MDDESGAGQENLSAAEEDEASTPLRRSLGKVDPSFYIIGVGASAGGLEAIKQLIGQVPDNFPHSFVIIQHISPDYKSLMSEILARETRLPVSEVTDDMAVEPGHIYLIPPKSNVIIQGTSDDTKPEVEDKGPSKAVGLRFSLVAPMPRPQLNLPIDLFFHSLSDAVGDRAIAIILSGTGTDGSRGLRAIKDRDGFVMVQEPGTANFDGMPQAAIATKIVDMVSSPDSMVSELQRYIMLREDGVINVRVLFSDAEEEFTELVNLVSHKADIDFLQYKEPTLQRRIARRIGLNQLSSVREYLEFARDRPHELSILHREFLVGVTNFFRDIPSWMLLRENIIPRLFEHGDGDEMVKVWSVGCSTGEEAYTIAILMEAYRREHNITRDFRVFATDVNPDAIRSAKEGVFPESVVEEIPAEYRGPEYLTFIGGTFHIAKALRARVLFSEHNVLEDPPYINTDLVTCRNMLIYLGTDIQKKILSLFSFSLRKDGFLFLGAAEHVARHSQNLEPEHITARIYRNARRPQRGVMRSSVEQAHAMVVSLPRGRRLATRESQRSESSFNSVMQLVLGNLDGCVFLIDEAGQVFETFGNYRDFVVLPDTAFSSNIFDLVHERLRSAISMQIRAAERDGSADSHGVKCANGGGIDLVDLHVSRIEWEASQASYMVMLRKTDVMKPQLAGFAESQSPLAVSDAEANIARLESEIESLQEMLSVTAEDLGVSNEELQTTNEELTVSNEELQANNEEMQSINEELHTVNAENAEKIVQLEAANADIENLLNTADMAIVFLDDNLAIRRFNAAFTRYIELTDSDEGRLLSNFSSSIEADDYAKLLDDVERARDTGEESSRDLRCRDGSWAQVRVRPFHLSDGEIEGVVISLTDTTRLRQLQDQVTQQRDRLAGLLESEAAGYWDWDIVNNTEYMSPRFKAMFGYEEHEIEDTPEAWMSIIHPADLPGVLKNFDRHVETRGAHPYDNEVRYYHKNGSIVWVQCRGRVVEWTDDGKPVRMLGVHIDISHLKDRERKVLREAEVGRFSFIAAHDLLQPMNTIERSLAALTEDIGPGLDEDGQRLVEFLNESTDRMRVRIQGVLDYGRFFSEELDLHPVDLTEIARGVISDLSSRIEEIGAEITLEDLPPAMGQKELLSRVFQNLIDNGMKYRHPDRPCRIHIKPCEQPHGMVGVSISDNGIGIAPEHHNTVFQLFSRLHTERDYPGIGVGLALSDRLIELHGGNIVIGPTQEEGTTFNIMLKGVQNG